MSPFMNKVIYYCLIVCRCLTIVNFALIMILISFQVNYKVVVSSFAIFIVCVYISLIDMISKFRYEKYQDSLTDGNN